MKGICPNCEKETDVERIGTREKVLVRGEPVEVDAEYSACQECGVEFEDTRGTDALSNAYREYRRRHAMLQPEEIRTWRKKYSLTQKELAGLLGWGDVTLSRYETGALQDEAHEKILRLAMEPHNLLKLIADSPDVLSDKKRNQLENELRSEEAQACSFDRLFEEKFGHYSPDEFSGYLKLNLQKLYNMILFFCVGGQLKTKLNKLLFYADFKYFKEHTISITGSRYARLPFGPVPDKYDWYFAELSEDGKLANEPEIFGQYVGEKYVATSDPDMSVFNESELAVLSETKSYFSNFSSTEITEFSHQERGYIETPHAASISYAYSEDLKI